MPKTDVIFEVEVEFPTGGDTYKAEVTRPRAEFGAWLDAGLEGMKYLAEDVISEARKLAAASHFDLEDFGNDSAYLDAVDRLADRLTITSIRRAGPQRRYIVDAQYDDGQPFTNDVLATDESDAEWQAAWLMAIGTSHKCTPTGCDDMLETIGDYRMLSTVYEPVPPEDVKSALAALYGAVENGRGTEDAMRRAKEVLELLDALPEPLPTAPVM